MRACQMPRLCVAHGPCSTTTSHEGSRRKSCFRYVLFDVAKLFLVLLVERRAVVFFQEEKTSLTSFAVIFGRVDLDYSFCF